ncbi:MAG TPA: hypothetical protein VNJ07_02645 [Chitinophagales bacterium]|nr:hypothetical protein [Chitinophagales bacterium]
MKSKLPYWLLLLVAVMCAVPVAAQCPMCRAAAEASIKEGSTHALGLNTGILYLLAFPYLLCTVIFLLWYRNHRKNLKLTNPAI